jgi:hypothetical protein
MVLGAVDLVVREEMTALYMIMKVCEHEPSQLAAKSARERRGKMRRSGEVITALYAIVPDWVQDTDRYEARIGYLAED